MIRIVVTGSECTGKTTLARDLSRYFGTLWVPEYVRQFVDEKGAQPDHSDVDAIAHGQIELEEEQAAQAKDLLILDTDLLSTMVYSRHYFGDCPLWIEEAIRQRQPDLYLLAGIDVPWVANGVQRDRGHRREEMQELFRQALIQQGAAFQEITGNREDRLRRAAVVIDPLLSI